MRSVDIAFDGLPTQRRQAAMFAILSAVAMAILDIAMINTALPQIANELNINPAESIWIVNVYQIVMISTLLPLAALGDKVGHRRVYLTGLVLFTFASLACTVSSSLSSLIIARGFQGLGGSALTSVNIAIIKNIYPSHQIGRGLGTSAFVVALSFCLGPIIASVILEYGSWPFLFAINIPIGIIAYFLANRTIPLFKVENNKFHAFSSVLIVTFLGSMALIITDTSHKESPVRILIETLVMAISLFILIKYQKEQVLKTIPFHLFQDKKFKLSNITAATAFISQGLAFTAMPFLFYSYMNRTMLEVGILIAPWPILIAVTAPIAGVLSDRFSAELLATVGLFIMCIGLGTLLFSSEHASTGDVLWRVAICGAGFGIFQIPNMSTIMKNVPTRYSGSASGIVATSRLMGQLCGTTLAAFCLYIWETNGSQVALLFACLLAGVASFISFTRIN